jgi:cytochrome c551/c552
MIHHRSIFKSFLYSVLPVLFWMISFGGNAQDGKQLFNQKCASCHAPDKQLVGPALKGVEEKWADRGQLYSWIRNSAAVVKSGYPRAVEVYNQFNKIQMTAFPELTDKDIDAILVYVED